MVDSPCIKVCQLNAAGVCAGCGRTGSEIGGWMSMSETQKAETVKAARNRLRALEQAGRGKERR